MVGNPPKTNQFRLHASDHGSSGGVNPAMEVVLNCGFPVPVEGCLKRLAKRWRGTSGRVSLAAKQRRAAMRTMLWLGAATAISTAAHAQPIKRVGAADAPIASSVEVAAG